MTKAVKYWFLAIVMGILGLVEAVSGFVLWFGFPEGGSGVGKYSGGIGSLSVWGVTKHYWVEIHDWVAVALTAIVVLHIILHWKWIYRVAKQIGRSKQDAVTVKAG